MSTAIGAVVARIHYSDEKATPDSDDELLVIENTGSEYVQRKITWASLLSAIGVVGGSGAAPAVTNQTAATLNASATSGENVIFCNCTSNSITVNLPTAVSNTGIFHIKKTDASTNTVTIDGATTETIDGSATAVISVQNVCLTLISDGTNWRLI